MLLANHLHDVVNGVELGSPYGPYGVAPFNPEPGVRPHDLQMVTTLTLYEPRSRLACSNAVVPYVKPKP